MTASRAVTLVGLTLAACSALLASQCGAFGASDTAAAADGGEEAAPLVREAGPTEAAAGPIGCVGNFCDCDGKASNGAETDVTKDDPQNCGACKRACPVDPVLMAPQCTAGVCAPAPLLKSLAYASVVVAYGDDAYFADGNPNGSPGSVRHAPPPGFTPSTITNPQPLPVTALAVDANDLYVISSQSSAGMGRLVRMPRAGDCDGGCTTTLDAPDGGVGIVPLKVAVSANAVFWVRQQSGNFPGQLMTQPKADGGPPVVMDERAGYNRAAFPFPTLALTSGFVYASHQPEPGVPSSDGIAALPLGGCPPPNPNCVADREPAPTAGLAADKDTLYYVVLGADGGASSISRVKDTAPTGASYITGRAGIGGVVAVDGRDFYWVESAPNGGAVTSYIMRSGKDGKCPTYAPCPQTVAAVTCADMSDTTCGVAAIAIGETQIFFARGGAKGGVYRIPK